MKSVGVSENGLWLIENAKTGEIEEFTDNMLSNDDYRQYLGNALPKLYLGWNNSFRYKNFDLNIYFYGEAGRKRGASYYEGWTRMDNGINVSTYALKAFIAIT